MTTIQITRHAPPLISPEQLMDARRTIRYRYEPSAEERAEHLSAFAGWRESPTAERALSLIVNHPQIFLAESSVGWPLQEIYAHLPSATPLMRTLGIAVTPLIIQLILENAPVATSSSGGKDSAAAALIEDELLNWLGHTGPRAIIFSDVGRLDWPDSRESVELR